MTGCFERNFQATTTAIAGAPSCLLPANFAHRNEFPGHSRNASAVYIFVARLANRYAIGNIVSKIWVIFPRLFMVGLKAGALATFLACVIIPLIDLVSPLAVFAGIAFLICIRFTFGSVAAFFGAIFDLQMTAGVAELFTAKLADEKLSLAINRVAFYGAGFRTFLERLNKTLAAYRAFCRSAFVAVKRNGGTRRKQIAALSTRLHGISSIHNPNYNTNRLQRWADMTGRQPVRVE